MNNGPFTEREAKRLNAITLQQWVTFVNRIHRAMARELLALESRQDAADAERNHELDEKKLRYLIAITQTMGRVRVINEAVANEEKDKRDLESLRRAETALEELQRRVDKLAAEA